MRKVYILLCTVFALGVSSCSDWLDVRPETEQKDKDMFSTYDGFCDALTGCYMSLASQEIYGERLTMTHIESLANLWHMPSSLSETNRQADWVLKHHEYTSTYAEDAIETMYAKLFNVVVQANMIIKNIDERGEQVILDPDIRSVIQGEAYAIRAYCQLDILRLFGQVPQGVQKVELPYSETTSIYEVPAYYDFDSYVGKLEYDLQKAMSLLKDKDPVFEMSFDELNSGGTAGVDEFMLYRQSRLNYWAVKALEARMYLYIGNREKAYKAAMEVIDAKLDGQPVMTMSGVNDFALGYKLCPSECLFYLSKYNVLTYSQAFLIGGNTRVTYDSRSHLVLTSAMFDELYDGQNINSHNRYWNIWNREVEYGGNTYVATTKYYWNQDNVTSPMLHYQIIPMLRMSEVYLIALETTDVLDDANRLYQSYMQAHSVSDMADFATLEEVKPFIIGEYRREFIAEGQMFYTYKRTATRDMMWCDDPMEEQDYILPLPRTEYNPN